jgi:hypothetical protein
MLVTGYLDTLGDHGIVDELIVLWLPCIEDLLDHMVPVDVLSQLSHPVLQKRREKSYVMRLFDYLDDLLYRPRPVSMLAKTDRVRLDPLYYLGKLIFQAVFGYLLGQVVPKGIVHYLKEGFYSVLENDGIDALDTIFYLLLKEATPSLIFG